MVCVCFFFFKQKTAYEMRISDWSSDVCSSDLSGTITDSMDGILEKVHEAGLTLKAGCGIGYEFSTLRPRGAFVAGAGAYTSGPMSFMAIYDKMCFTVSSAGGRRGAQRGNLDVRHPAEQDFIDQTSDMYGKK